MEWHNGVTDTEDDNFRCPCGLVWKASFLAIGCTYRNHAEAFVTGGRPDGPPVAGVSVNHGDRVYRALRREGTLTITVTVTVDEDGRRAIAEWASERGVADQTLCEHWAEAVLGQAMEAIRPIRVGK